MQINPAHPGLQCHRFDNIKDKNFWSARVSRDIRLIFHRVESSVMLCYVAPITTLLTTGARGARSKPIPSPAPPRSSRSAKRFGRFRSPSTSPQKQRGKAQVPEHISEVWIGTSWIVEVTVSGTRDGRPFQPTHLFLTSLRTTPEALLQLVRDRWSIEGWPRRDGHAAHRCHEPVAPGWVPLVPDWLTGGDARHHGAADNGAAPAGTDSWLNFESTLASSQSSPRPTDSPSGKGDKSPWVAALEGSATLNKKNLANWKSACQS